MRVPGPDENTPHQVRAVSSGLCWSGDGLVISVLGDKPAVYISSAQGCPAVQRGLCLFLLFLPWAEAGAGQLWSGHFLCKLKVLVSHPVGARCPLPQGPSLTLALLAAPLLPSRPPRQLRLEAELRTEDGVLINACVPEPWAPPAPGATCPSSPTPSPWGHVLAF